MNLSKLFLMQKTLDERIQKEHNPDKDLIIHKKTLALLVELGELANETRCFKYWSKKGPSERSVIIEEFVDCLHFILSIGISKNFLNPSLNHIQISNIDLSLLFLDLNNTITKFANTQSEEDYNEIFNKFLILGEALGFSETEIETAYVYKNEVNHQRQDEGY